MLWKQHASMARIWSTAIIVSLQVLVVRTGADMGSIPFLPGVEILEPKQRAIIAWNGKEEILVLSTTLSASAETDVLEVIPLPAEPTVTKGSEKTFEKTNALIGKALGMETRAYSIEAGTMGGGPSLPAGEVTAKTRIGVHDISVTRVLDSAGFVKWVEDYLKTSKVENPDIPAPMTKVIEEYLADGFIWFVFDVVHLTRTATDKQPIRFRFKTDSLYYPLRITRVEKGETKVQFFIFSQTPLKEEQFRGIPPKRVKLVHRIIKVRGDELTEIDQEIHGMLGRPDFSALRTWEITGKLAEFEQDLLVSGAAEPQGAGGGHQAPPPARPAGTGAVKP